MNQRSLSLPKVSDFEELRVKGFLRGFSTLKGRVTTLIVRAPSSLAILATTGDASVPVPPRVCFLKGHRRIFGLLLSFLPAMTIMAAFTLEITCPNRPIYPSYIPSTIIYYVLPSAIGYTLARSSNILRKSHD